MNKTVKRGFSLFIAMVFALSMIAVPTAFAAGLTDLGTEGWKVALYADENCQTPITALAPGQEAYVQFSLTNIRAILWMDAQLTATGMTFQEITRWDYNAADSALENADQKVILSTNPGYNKVDAGKPTVFMVQLEQNTAGESPDATANAFLLKGQTDATAGTELKIVTLKVKADDAFAGNASVIAEPIAGFAIGKTQGRTPVASDLSANAVNLTGISTPTLDNTQPPVLVEGDVEDATNTMDVPKNKDPFAEGGYSFRVKYTNGATVDLPLSLKPAAEVTDNEKGAFVNAAVADFVPTTEGQPMTVDVVVVDNTAGVKKATITDGIKFNVSDTTYTLKSKPTFEIAAGLSDFDKAYLVEVLTGVLQKNEGDGYVDMGTAEINALNITLIDKATSQAYDGTNKKENDETEATVQIDTITLETSDALIKTTAAEKTGKYKLKDVAYTVYLAALSKTEPYSAALNIETLYTDGSAKDEGLTTTAYTISTEDWETFYAAAEAAEAVLTVPVTLTDENISGTQIKLDVKHSQPTGNYRVKAGQTFPINYKGTVDTSAIEFQQQVQDVPDDETTIRWVAFDASAYKVVLSDFDNTVNGTNEVTVSLVGDPAITLDPATITVTVKINPTYTAKWFNDAAQIPVGTTEDEIKTMILIEADYDGVTEAVKVDLDKLAIDGYTPDATEAQSITVTYDGKAAGSLPLTLAPVGTGAVVNADIEIVGVDMLGLLNGSVTAGTDTFNFGLTNDGKVKLIGIQATAAANEFTLSIPGFSPVTISVADDQTVTVDGKLYAGEVANSAEKAINDADFYAVAANVGNAVADATIKYDINRDGKIDELDVAAVIANLGTELVEVTE